MKRYNTSTFSNKEGAADRSAQRKALVAPLHQIFDGQQEHVVGHLADISHRCDETGVYNDFYFVIGENKPPTHLDTSDPVQRIIWESDPDRFIYGNLFEDSSQATIENIKAMRDDVRRTIKTMRVRPKANSIEAEHLVSYQNRQWIFDMLVNSWTSTMITTMTKYLETHDNDGVVLLYCFIKHFAGASKENIIEAYQQLTESKVQLSLYKNIVPDFTNALRIPVRKLANANEQPTFQHFLNVYHGICDCPNEEFRSFALGLYKEYRNDGPAKSLTMLELLDELDNEYNRIKALNRWVPKENTEIIALTAEVSKLKATITKLNNNNNNGSNNNNSKNNNTKKPNDVKNTSSTNSGTNAAKVRSKKPLDPPKPGAKLTTTVDGVTWKWCQTCFSGKGSWNKTHTTDQHVVGAGKGYQGKKETPASPDTTTATANLAAKDESSGGIFLV